MSPLHPSASHWFSRAAVRGAASARAIPNAANPCARATASRRSSRGGVSRGKASATIAALYGKHRAMPYGCDTFSVCPEEGLSEVEAPSRRTRRSIDVLRDAISTSSMAPQDKRPICRDRHLNDFSVEADGLTKYFGDYKAVDGVSLAVPAGSFYGVLGPNGAGKTTSLRMTLDRKNTRLNYNQQCANSMQTST